MSKTSCYSYFGICSSGEMQNGGGFVAAKDSDFDPDYITAKLGIEPFDTMKMGAPDKHGSGCNLFSDWCCCKQSQPALDAQEQCRTIVRQLYDRIPQLREIKKEFHVDYTIMIVPSIRNEERPILGFDSEIIEFCYLTGTEIYVDMY